MNAFQLRFKWWKEYNKLHPNPKKYYYEAIPVFCCKECHSLHIKIDPELGDYCGDCGCTETEKLQYKEWERKYRFTKIQSKL